MSDLDLDIDDYEFDNEEVVALESDEKNVGGKRSEWFKMANKGQTVRCSFIYFHTVDANAVKAARKKAKKDGEAITKDLILEAAKAALVARAEELGKAPNELSLVDKLDITQSNFKVLKAHYQEGMGYVMSRLGKDGAEADQVWKRLEDPKTYFSTLLLIYPTDSEGVISKEQLARQIKENKLTIIPWRFSNRTYESIWKLNAGLRENGITLASQDIRLECKEPKYQNIDVSAAGPALWQKNESFQKNVLTAAANWYDKLVPFREMTTDQLKAKLGLTGSAEEEDISADSFQDMLDGV